MSLSDKEKKQGGEIYQDDSYEITTTVNGEVVQNTDQLHRQLNNRQIQLIAIGGSIGTALFVTIGMISHRLLNPHLKRDIADLVTFAL